MLNKTLKHKPKDGSAHWSSRKLAAELGEVSFSAVQCIWRKHGLQPHRLEQHLVSNDPDFETKAEDVIGLYLNPPCTPQCSAWTRRRRFRRWIARTACCRWRRAVPRATGLSTAQRRPQPFRCLNTATGEVLGMTAPRHTNEQFVSFLGDVVCTQLQGREIHVICDNVSSHKTELVEAFDPVSISRTARS